MPVGARILALLTIDVVRAQSAPRPKDGMTDRAAFHRQSMRAWMASLEQHGQSQTISAPVSLDYDIAACLAAADRGPALRYDNVVGHAMPVVGNLLNALPRFVAATGATPTTLQSTIIAA